MVKRRRYDPHSAGVRLMPDFTEKPFPDYPPGLTREQIEREFSHRVQTRMRQFGWNQSKTAEEAKKYHVEGNFGRDLVSNYCRAHSKGKLPNPPNLAALAKAFRMDPENLLPAVFPSRNQSVIKEPMAPTSMENANDGTSRLKLNVRLPTKIALQLWAQAIEHDLDRRE